METTWSDRTVPAPGHTLSFQECLRIVSRNVKARVVTPKWAYSVSKKLKAIDIAFTEMEVRRSPYLCSSDNVTDLTNYQQYIREVIQERSSSASQKKHDLLSSLIESNQLEDASSSTAS